MRNWARNVHCTAKRVFFSIATGWLVVFHSIWIAHVLIWEDWDYNGYCGQCALADLLYRMALALAWPTEVAVTVYESVSNNFVGNWVVGATFFVGPALSSVTWATITTITFVLARRWRVRGTASGACR